jgi:hypothetical protein
MKLPVPRGDISATLCDRLTNADAATAIVTDVVVTDVVSARLPLVDDLVHDDDIQVTLFILNQLHYTGFDEVDDSLEWDPALLQARSALERRFEAEVRQRVALPTRPAANADAVAEALFDLTAPTAGPSLSRFVAKQATADQLAEFLIHRSLYQLMEADPHTWAIPRLSGRAKAALVEVQTDEYGNGRPELMHSALFAQTMRGVGLDDEYGHYFEELPAVTISSLNLMSMFGLNRRLLGAIAGHLAAFEMTSSIPNRFYGDGFRRHGFGPGVTLYFDEHVEADAVHEQIAGRDLAGGLVDVRPELLDDVLFGAAACLELDGLVGDHILSSWKAGRSSLRTEPSLVGTAPSVAGNHARG